MSGRATLTERIVEAARPLGPVAVVASVGDDVLVDHRPAAGPDDRPVWNVWCATKPAVACAVLALLERAGVSSDRPLHEYVPVTGAVADDELTVAALLRHETRLPPLDPVEIEMLAPADRPARLGACLDRTARRPAPAAAYSQFLGWWLLLAAVEATYGHAAEPLVQAELDGAGHEDLLVWIPPEGHAGLEARLALYTTGDDRFERSLVHDRARTVVVHGSAALRGYASAASLHRWYADLGATLAGRRPHSRPGFPSLPVLTGLLARPRSAASDAAEDETLRRRCCFAGGFMVGLSTHHFGSSLSPRALGHAGWRGLSLGLLDPDTGLVIGLLHPRTGPSAVVSSTRERLVGLLAEAAA